MIYAPGWLDSAKTFDMIGGQIDIFPTVMGLLRYPYTNNTFGIDLLRESRPATFFTEDNKMACLNKEYMYVISLGKDEYLYHYSTGDTRNIINENRGIADSLKFYMFPMLQGAQWMFEKNLTGIK